MQDDGRRYRVLGLIGTGGFGKVYRARLEAEGFTKEVAIKVMSEAEPPEEVLHRFRDEARMLGLVRDRAIVAADPPVRIGGHWAVVMEFVDGCTLGRLIAAHGQIPPSVALEIVGEVARALDKVFHHPGPHGEPLKLLHRDIKPGNLQITAHGEVKILDFGVARAQLDDREAKTQGWLVGTYDYMAPERLQGIEVPAGDVYSLGRVLEEMLLGRRRVRGEPRVEPADADDPSLRAALQLANEMTRLDPDVRPGARDVEHRCEVLLAATGRNPSLRSWAERTVPDLTNHGSEDDGLVGEVLSEAASTGRRRVPLGGPDPVPSDGAGPDATVLRPQIPQPASRVALPVPAPPETTAPPPPASGFPRWAMLAAFAVVLVAVAGASLAAGMFAAGVTTIVFLGGPEQPEVAPVPAAPEEAAASSASPTFGFERAGGERSPSPDGAAAAPPADIPGLAPPPDDTARPQPVGEGVRADLVLGQGRAAVIELGMRPTALRITRGAEVVEAPPYLVLGGAVPGRGRLVVEFEGGGERTWVYDVLRDPTLDPSGGPNLIERRERLVVPESVGAVCTLGSTPRAAILMDESRGRLQAMGHRGFYVEASTGTLDVVFDVPGAPPRVLTVAPVPADAPPEETAPPEGCVVAPAEPVRLPVGGEMVLPVGQTVSNVVIGDPDRFEVLRVDGDPKKIRIRALRAGTTAVAVTDPDGANGWVRRVVSE